MPIVPYLIDNAAIIGKIWLLVFLAGYPFNIGMGRTGLRPMSYGEFLGALTMINALLATVITGVAIAADYLT